IRLYQNMLFRENRAQEMGKKRSRRRATELPDLQALIVFVSQQKQKVEQ
ncbi:unnamed protein product, partial [marine sediment metagenome]